MAAKNKKPKVVETRNLKKYERTLCRNDLQQVDWETIFNSCNNNRNEMTTTFQEIFQLILDIHAPIKKKKLHSQTAPWMTPLVRELMIKRDAAKKVAKRSPAMWNLYKKLRNQVTKSIREAITSNYQGLIKENKDRTKKDVESYQQSA